MDNFFVDLKTNPDTFLARCEGIGQLRLVKVTGKITC